ncbi:hypothetical protein AB0M39_23755 [Streptomyces sp. NPDC051907]|uniref:hypothetical protein n=1 Tax=Streptomyces sp. NPDC051907 TaxID=3155284 RepID=UPI003443990D
MPVARRHTALRCAVGHYRPLGFNATWAYLAATACPAPDLRRDPAALLRALETLEASRAVQLYEREEFAARRRTEKAAGRRTPCAADAARLRGPRWPSETAPSRLGLIAAVADRHAAFRRSPYPDESLSYDAQVRQLADLHARLDACASSYLKALGRLDGPAAEELAATAQGILSLTRPGYAPLNMYLLSWLAFSDLLAYAAEASRGPEPDGSAAASGDAAVFAVSATRHPPSPYS